MDQQPKRSEEVVATEPAPIPEQTQFLGMSDDDEPMAVYRLPFSL